MRTWCLSLTILGLVGIVFAQPFVPPPPTPITTPYVGAASCSAAACHNQPSHPSVVGSEFGIWAERDPHARAYEVLFNDASLRILKSLGGDTKPHEDKRCLKCHVGVEMDDELNKQIPYFRTDGVSCESCHGPARQWLTSHYAPSWRDKTPAQKRQLGMKDTKSVHARVELCVTCHVGDIDHDLIAAGHPALNFEFTAFHEAMPHHWPAESDFAKRAWLPGQLLTTRGALNLLAERADDKRKPWPEFAEHECAACHHDLGTRTKKVERNAIPWSSWNLALTPTVLKSLHADTDAMTQLQKELANGWQDRKAIAAKARRLADQLKAERDNTPDGLLPDILALKGTSLDERVQAALAVAALRGTAPPLTLPGGYAKSNVHPLPIRTRLLNLKASGGN